MNTDEKDRRAGAALVSAVSGGPSLPMSGEQWLGNCTRHAGVQLTALLVVIRLAIFFGCLCGGIYMKTIQRKGAGFLKFLKWIILNENPDRQLDAVNDIKSLEI